MRWFWLSCAWVTHHYLQALTLLLGVGNDIEEWLWDKLRRGPVPKHHPTAQWMCFRCNKRGTLDELVGESCGNTAIEHTLYPCGDVPRGCGR